MRRFVLAALASAVIVAIALVITANDDNGDERATHIDAGTSTTAATASTTDAPATTAAARGPRGNGTAVTFAFAGDVNFPEQWDTEDGPPPTAPPLSQQVTADPRHLLDPVAPVLSKADLAMVNLETAVT